MKSKSGIQTAKRSLSKSRSGKGAAIAIAAVVIVIIAAAAVVMLGGNMFKQNTSPDDPVDPVKPEVLLSDSEIFLGLTQKGTGDFETSKKTLSYKTDTAVIDGKNRRCMTFALDESKIADYTAFKWVIKEKDHSAWTVYIFDKKQPNAAHTLDKSTDNNNAYMMEEYVGDTLDSNLSFVNWTDIGKVGEFNVKVYCYKTDADKTADNNGVVYSGDYFCTGKITKKYEWNYDNKKFSVTSKLNYADYCTARDSSISRQVSKADMGPALATMVKNDSNVTALVAELKSAFTAKYPDKSVTGQDYADFLLGFVNMNFKYPALKTEGGSSAGDVTFSPDKTLYDRDEYYAFPIQTLFYGIGDCEDTSMLMASIFKAAGYSAAVGIVPGHAVAGVAIPGYVNPEISSQYLKLWNNTDSNGTTFYVCETTIHTMPIKVGLMHINAFKDLNNSTHKFYAVAT